MRNVIVCGSILAAIALPAAAVPVLNPGNGHYYELIRVSDPFGGTPAGDNNSWFRARDAAAASTWLGENGHLATITSQLENDFVFSLVVPPPTSTSPFSGAWLGGDATQWLVGSENGDPLVFDGWGGSEPNNGGFMYMNIGGPFAGIASGTWADDSGANGFPEAGLDPVVGYFVEYDTPFATRAPEPETLALLGLGLLGLRVVRRYKLR